MMFFYRQTHNQSESQRYKENRACTEPQAKAAALVALMLESITKSPRNQRT
jgi:hypothetical protein